MTYPPNSVKLSLDEVDGIISVDGLYSNCSAEDLEGTLDSIAEDLEDLAANTVVSCSYHPTYNELTLSRSLSTGLQQHESSLGIVSHVRDCRFRFLTPPTSAG